MRPSAASNALSAASGSPEPENAASSAGTSSVSTSRARGAAHRRAAPEMPAANRLGGLLRPLEAETAQGLQGLGIVRDAGEHQTARLGVERRRVLEQARVMFLDAAQADASFPPRTSRAARSRRTWRSARALRVRTAIAASARRRPSASGARRGARTYRPASDRRQPRRRPNARRAIAASMSSVRAPRIVSAAVRRRSVAASGRRTRSRECRLGPSLTSWPATATCSWPRTA